ncbi:hypothetical protein B0H16DRAFT_1770376 [Mycena metata]|uniref:Uncharacterized protein n=1 Tax=Mycena metata TaxID=1033252 RepID=A0AAD7I2A7_9AGAR|nr:hypothetical protein B0H16DRAFT_1770376 [Mycena metata]
MHSILSIRRSNGRLCVDFSPQPDGKNEGHNFFYNLFPSEPHPPINPSSNPTSQEAAAIHSLTLEEYHCICWFTLCRYRSGSVSSFATISSGAVILFPPNGQLESDAEIACLPGAQFYGGDWHRRGKKLDGIMENDWIRLNAKEVGNDTLSYTVWPGDALARLTQANYIFSRLQITSNLEDYGVASYWSLDPSGVDRLSTEEAAQLGFPSFQLTTEVKGCYWDTSVYGSLRKFHQGKGFNPDSQDVARHLGQRLYKLSREVDSPFAHVEEDSEDEEDGFDDGTNEGETDEEWEDAQSSVEVEQDGDESTDCDANEDEGLLNFSTEQREQNTAEACQEPAHSVDQDPNPAESRVLTTGIGFVHRIIGGLQRGLVIETEDLDTNPISPFLI